MTLFANERKQVRFDIEAIRSGRDNGICFLFIIYLLLVIYIMLDAAAHYLVPHPRRIPKKLSRLSPFKVHLHGIMNFTWQTAEMYYLLDYFPDNPNLSLTILWLHLTEGLWIIQIFFL